MHRGLQKNICRNKTNLWLFEQHSHAVAGSAGAQRTLTPNAFSISTAPCCPVRPRHFTRHSSDPAGHSSGVHSLDEGTEFRLWPCRLLLRALHSVHGRPLSRPSRPTRDLSMQGSCTTAGEKQGRGHAMSVTQISSSPIGKFVEPHQAFVDHCWRKLYSTHKETVPHRLSRKTSR